MTSDLTKPEKFQNLVREAQNCRRCEALCERVAVLSERNGNLNPKVMFVAEAPGVKAETAREFRFRAINPAKIFKNCSIR